MKTLKYFSIILLAAYVFVGCKKDPFTDTSLATSVASASNLSIMFNITQDNTGLVTVTPNGSNVTSYDVYYGDATTAPASVASGKSIQHTYAEGTYQVKIIAHDLKGGSTTYTQQLVVSFLAPTNLAVKLSKTNTQVNISATATNAAMFKIYFGDSTTVVPIPFTLAMQAQNIVHNYVNAGTYYIKVVALSGGVKTTQVIDTVKVGKQINLPVTFNDPSTDYTVSDFGGNASVLTTDPVNSANQVMKSVKTVGAQTWAGTTLGPPSGTGFSSAVPLNANSLKMTVMVYSPAAGLDVKLKLDNHLNPNNGLSVETDVKTTLSKQWETLTFDFSKPATGTPAWNSSNTYDLASIFFDFGNSGTGFTFYFYNVMMQPVVLQQINLPVTFNDPTVNYSVTDFGGNSSVLVTDPLGGTYKVMKSVKTAGAATYAGTTLGPASGTGFSSPIPLTSSLLKMTVLVYSPAAGLDVKLKLDNHLKANSGFSVETDVKTTLVNQWETLTFDFSKPASGTPSWSASNTYDLASIFFDFGNTGTGSTFYFYNLKMGNPGGALSQISLPVTFEDATVDYSLTDFGSNSSSMVLDPTNNANHVIKTIKTVGAQTWAGTTMGPSTGTGFSSPIAFTSSRTKMTVMVYSPAVGLHIRLKVEDHTDATKSVETEAITTLANRWETLTFDFSNQASGTAPLNLSYNYDKASIFFDFNNAGTGSVFYWDNVTFL